MKKGINRILALSALVFQASTHAQQPPQIQEWESFEERIASTKSIQVLNADSFGDSVSLQDGALSFAATDVDLPGNNALPVKFSRRFAVKDSRKDNANHRLIDWAIEAPRIYGSFADQWIAGTSPNRCSNQLPPDISSPSRPEVMTEAIFQGIHLEIPGVASGELKITDSSVTRPTSPDPLRPYIWTTDAQIHIRCLPAVQNAAGEGFVAITADGTEYTFNWMAARSTGRMTVKRFDTASGTLTAYPLNLAERSLYATEVRDRFGNWVRYTYTNAENQVMKLTKILASDGREIDIQYRSDGVVEAVRAGEVPGTLPPQKRTWTYNYETSSAASGRQTLRYVVLPDQRQWTINFGDLTFTPINYTGTDHSCYFPSEPENPGQVVTGSLVHPSGATATYQIGLKLHGRHGVTLSCENVIFRDKNGATIVDPDPTNDSNFYPMGYFGWSLLSKEITGKDVETQRWDYNYTENFSFQIFQGINSELPYCSQAVCTYPQCTSEDCAQRQETTIGRPDGTVARYVFGSNWQFDEGKLISEEVLNGSLVVQRTKYTYEWSAGVSGSQYPQKFGTSLQGRIHGYTAEQNLPLVTTTKELDGVSFVSSNYTGRTLHLDALMRPRLSNEFSSLGFGKQTRFFYYDSTAPWVRSQIQRIVVGNEETYRAEYRASDALLDTVFEFGQKTHSLEYRFFSCPQGGTCDGQNATVSKITDGALKIRELNSWKRGMPRQVKFHDQNQISAAVDDNGWVTSATDALGQTTSYTYDNLGRMQSLTPPLENGQVYWAPTSWTLVRETDTQSPLRNYWRHREQRGAYTRDTFFDDMLRPVVVREYGSGGTPQRYSVKRYDSMNRLQFESYPLSTFTGFSVTYPGTTFTYDAIGRVRTRVSSSELTQSLITEQTEYLSGFKRRETNGRGYQTTYEFQAFSDPDAAVPVKVIAPEGQTTTIVRDVYGKPLEISRASALAGGPASVSRRFVYDAQQRLCKRIEPETGAAIFDYNGVGKLSWSAEGTPFNSATECSRELVGAADKINYSYDDRHRLTGIDYPSPTEDVSYTYYADGAQSTATRGTAIWTYGYTSTGVLDYERLDDGARSFEFSRTYDSNGFLTSTVYPGSEVVVASPNALGQPTQVGSFLTGVLYHPGGQWSSGSFGNGVSLAQTLNTRALPLALSYRLPNLTYAYQAEHTYDRNANIEVISGSHPQSFTYDGLDRLKTAVAPTMAYQSAVYDYDEYDNIRRYAVPGRDLTYVYGADNRLASLQIASPSVSVPYLYDTRGNVTSVSGLPVVFDRANLVRQISNNAAIESYRYDAHGHRIQVNSTAAPGDRYSVYTHDGLLRMEVRSGGTDRYYYLGSQLIAKKSLDGVSTSTVWYASNLQGSNVAEINALGVVTNPSQFAPYGERVKQIEVGPGFAGHYEDGTSLTYMKARYYGGIVGRFISPDLVQVDGGSGANFNRYWYGNNNPLKFVDPDGRNPALAIWAARCAASWVCRSGVQATAVATVAYAAQPMVNYIQARQAAYWTAQASSSWAMAEVHDAGAETQTPDPAQPSSPSIDPADVAGKTPDEIERLAGEKGLNAKGPDPKAGRGSYTDPVTGEQRILVHPDANCGPHCHVNNPQGERLDINGKVVPPESPDAHLPLKPQ